ncbi:uncharacterized alpha-E superfamily protein [Jatrophihabitans sp. GAS493]|uniref:alpha-E domain-containing protein n=1 Tax=Jatrophihabitans sp. GAS493 TaxID=1907575 RepID=UPI000BB76F7B|nr:alpha-E domain-containing protein [Jatrophihabitans sp. GAS493]SOD75094.1 uncharacterized alpha-E superfamily protein [Jatrophihabitans sp. GAS493]
MLSRIAESLYWIGRYVERAEDTSRTLDVHLNLLLEDPWAPEGVVCASLLSAMGCEIEPDAEIDKSKVLELLAWDRENPASIVGAITVARENARRSREVISTELWETLNVTWHEATRSSRRSRPHSFFTWVRERSAAFNGTADATLSRDEAYHFLALGRAIERADMTARLVAARALAGDAGPSWVTLLQSCGAYQAFLHSAHGAVEDQRAVEFLLLDPLFPRSLISALTSAERSMDDLSGEFDRFGSASEGHRVLGMIRSELEFAPRSEIFDDLYQLMERVQSACSLASDAVTKRYFAHGVAKEWAVS